MNWKGYREIKVSDIVLPGDIRERQRQTHVEELAESIRTNGQEPIHAPTVHAETRVLIAGRDRMAALLLLKAKRVWVRLVDASDEEAADLEDVENLHRRQDDRDALIARMVKRRAAQLPDKLNVKSPRQNGRPTTPVGAAREEVAKEIGATPEAVRAAVNRAEAPAKKPRRALPPADAVVEHWGLGAPPGYDFAEIAMAQEALDRTDKALRIAQAELGKLDEGCGQFGKRMLARLQSTVHGAADAVRRSRPEAICPWCKLLPNIKPTCGGCSGLGYVGREALSGIAGELLRSGDDAMVVLGGKLTPIAKARAEHKAAKKIRIEDGAGNPIDVEEDPF